MLMDDTIHAQNNFHNISNSNSSNKTTVPSSSSSMVNVLLMETNHVTVDVVPKHPTNHQYTKTQQQHQQEQEQQLKNKKANNLSASNNRKNNRRIGRQESRYTSGKFM